MNEVIYMSTKNTNGIDPTLIKRLILKKRYDKITC